MILLEVKFSKYVFIGEVRFMKKYAVCIGNSNYKYLKKLDYSINDAEDVQKSLKELGFETTLYSNLDAFQIGVITDEIERIAEEEIEVFLIYYAGHGFESDGENLLIPVDFANNVKKGCAKQVCYKLNDALSLLSQFENVIKIIILDSCREQYIQRGFSKGGFCKVVAPVNTVVLFATSPNSTASEPDELGHGIFTKALLDNIKAPYIKIEDLFKKISNETMRLSFGKQLPWMNSSLMVDFYFNSNNSFDKYTYNDNAFKDQYYDTIYVNQKIYNAIIKLREHDWKIQQEGFKIINSLDFTEQMSIDDLFVLGRNICQAYEGNCFAAQIFLEKFNGYHAPIDKKIHILNGIAYEMYFDHDNKTRVHYNSSALDSVLKLLSLTEFLECSHFISHHLNLIDDRFIFIPDRDKIIEIDVYTSLNEDRIVAETMKYKNCIISSYKLCETVNRKKKDGFKKALANAFMCNEKLIKINFDRNITDDTVIEFENLYYIPKDALI